MTNGHKVLRHGSPVRFVSLGDAERDVAWLLDRLPERDARIAELEARLRRDEWTFSLPSDPGQVAAYAGRSSG